MRVLIVEDNMALADGVMRAFKKMGLAVDAVNDGEEADHVLSIQKYDLVILDLNLPGIDGLEILRRLRDRGNKVQVIILTARDQIQDRVEGLDLGADDYLTKPFDLSELEARVRALLRRQSDQAKPIIKHGRLSFDTIARRVWIDEDALELPRRELSLLELLLNRVGKVVSKDQIADSLASFDHDITPNTVETHVSRLRKRIKAADVSIKTIRGLGYLLEKPG
jgi:two-component system OmpR family response regulator